MPQPNTNAFKILLYTHLYSNGAFIGPSPKVLQILHISHLFFAKIGLSPKSTPLPPCWLSIYTTV